MSVDEDSVSSAAGREPANSANSVEVENSAAPVAAPAEEALDEFFEAPDEPTAPPVRRRATAPQRRPSAIDRRTAGRLRARKVRRLVRHVEPWSVLKISLLFYFCLWGILLIAGVLLWSAANGSGPIDSVETFIRELFALETFQFDGDQIFRASAVGGLVLVVAATGFNVLMAVLFNLISDLTGGIRITVIEEETARPMVRAKRRRPATEPPREIEDPIGVDAR